MLEVLKEEHGSSGSDTNGVASHEEGVSEKPLVLDHPMFGSSKYEKDRHSHKSGHRRHHHHRRKKKFHMKSPSLEVEPSSFDSNGCIPEVDGHTFRNHVPRLNSSEEEACLSPKVETHTHECTQLIPPVQSLVSSAATQSQDDKVQELIMRSRQLIADQTTVMNGVPAITDICSTVTSSSVLTDVCGSVPSKSPMTGDSDSLCSIVSSDYSPFDACGTVPLKVHFMETEDEKPSAKIDSKLSSSLGDLSRMSHHMPCVDLGVAEVIRRSQELLGEVYRPNTLEDKRLPVREIDEGLVKGSEHLIESKEMREEVVNSAEDGPKSSNPLEDKISLTTPGTDSVTDLISRSRELLRPNQSTEQRDSQRNVGVNLEHCRPAPILNEKSSNYPPPFTEKPLDQPSVLPPHVSPVLGARIHSGNTHSMTSNPITDISDMYHLNSLTTDRVMCSGSKPDMKHEEQSEMISCRGKDQEEFGIKKTHKNENFDQGLNGIDLNEIKFVLSQAKKLLEKSSELREGAEQIDMNIDENVKGTEGNYTSMDIDETNRRGDVTGASIDSWKDNVLGDGKESVAPESFNEVYKVVLKDISSFQNQIDLVTPVSESADIRQPTAVFEIAKVRLSPPLEMQTSRYKCLTRFRVSSECKDSERNSQFNDELRTSTEYRHDALVKKRSSETMSERNEDSTHKHFKNSILTLYGVNLPAAVSDPMLNKANCAVGNGKYCYRDDDIKPRLNGTSFDLNIGTRLIADTNCEADTKNQLGKDYKSGKSSPKYESASLQNPDGYSNGVIEHLDSDDVVERLCGSTCRNNAVLLNSKDSARLQSFYATLKIKSIMRNRTRPQKRHDTYPF